ncbi:hypothetical protein WJX84_002383 [Apatococcus fuscideae]|uniref:Uncharacterized protein n=1 Tax=Apatococcus fuscideae TaxID=2026836 RepID=A0AAW1T1R6_9CHLO
MQQAQAVFTSYRINKNCCAAPPSLATLATRYRLQDHATFPCERLCELKVTQTDQAVQSPFNGAHFRATFAAHQASQEPHAPSQSNRLNSFCQSLTAAYSAVKRHGTEHAAIRRRILG